MAETDVKPLDLSNLLRHAFRSGFEMAANDATQAISDTDHWPLYVPEACAAYHRICAALSGTREAGEPVAWPDFAAPPQYDNPAEGWSDPRLPDFRLIWKTARSVGYSVGLHGSMKRDCDLIATPWIEDAQSSEALIEALCRALNARQVGEVEQKPHGRVAVTLQIDGYFKPIDLSIAAPPPAEVERGAVTDETVRLACPQCDFGIGLHELGRGQLPAALASPAPCTCHPDDNPPRPCPQKYALSECRAAAPQPAVETQGVTDEALRAQYWNAFYGHIDAHQGNTSEASARSHASGVVDRAIFEAGEPTPPTPASAEVEAQGVERETLRLQNEWDNCDEMLQATRAALASEKARADRLERALILIAHTETEDSHGGSKNMPSEWYRNEARAALRPTTTSENGGMGE